MIVLSYGIPKSGSTLACEAARGVALAHGHSQERIKSEHVRVKGSVNGAAVVNRSAVEGLLQDVEPGRVVVVKTHAPIEPSLVPFLEDLIKEGRLAVHCVYRDPRDICLSLVDAGARARANGREPFSEITDVEQAAVKVQRRIKQFLVWATIRGAVRIYYEDIAFKRRPRVLERIADSMRLELDADQVEAHLAKVWTQQNKMVSERHKADLDGERHASLTARFQEFIDGACSGRPIPYFRSKRAELRESLSASSEAAEGERKAAADGAGNVGRSENV